MTILSSIELLILPVLLFLEAALEWVFEVAPGPASGPVPVTLLPDPPAGLSIPISSANCFISSASVAAVSARSHTINPYPHPRPVCLSPRVIFCDAPAVLDTLYLQQYSAANELLPIPACPTTSDTVTLLLSGSALSPSLLVLYIPPELTVRLHVPVPVLVLVS